MISLKVQNIKKHYDDFDLEIDFEVADGEIISILGASGSGKTTLLRILSGLEQADSGNIIIQGQDATHVLPQDRKIGFLFQNLALFPHMNVLENVLFGLDNIKKSEAIQIAKNVLSQVGLNGYEKRYIQELSGGEKQRLALARTLAPKPSIILFDEPFSSLDQQISKKLRKEIKYLLQKNSITAIFITHNQEEAMYMADRILLMENGKKVQFDTAIELWNNPKSIYVANFFGEGNIIPLEQCINLFTDFNIKTLSKNNTATFLFFRPEKVHTQKTHDDDFCFHAIIDVHSFAGNYQLLEMHNTDIQLVCKTDIKSIFHSDTQYTFYVQAKDIHWV